MRLRWKSFLLMLLCACHALEYPSTISPVRSFSLERYLGTWYEIARLDHSFERDLQRVSANYSLLDDGGIRVLNRGYSTRKDAWKAATGKAYFVRDTDEGFLKVSFFGPFYGSYVIFELDSVAYQYAFVSGPDESYLWFLSRTPDVSTELRDHFVRRAAELGFPVSELIFVDQQ